MAPRLAPFALILAFGVSVAFAAVTTFRQVHLANTSPVKHARSCAATGVVSCHRCVHAPPALQDQLRSRTLI
jgi:hypothetical protein